MFQSLVCWRVLKASKKEDSDSVVGCFNPWYVEGVKRMMARQSSEYAVGFNPGMLEGVLKEINLHFPRFPKEFQSWYVGGC